MNIFNNISLGVVSVGTIVASWFGYAPIKEQVNLGASTQSSEVRALFTTTLASKITSSATSMTLSSATDKDGTVLASSTYGFIIDEGTSKEELVLADCTGTTCTNMTRGLSVRTGTTTVAALQFEHGRGAEVKITDAPALIYASNVFRGKQNLEYKLRYDTTQTFSNANDIISRSYADSLSFGAVPAASESASGFVELSTGVETASSTSSGGTGARLAIPASLATSTYNSVTAGLKVVVTQNDGKIDSNFIDSSAFPTLAGTNTWTGRNLFSTSTATSTMIGSMPAYWIGKNIQIFTSDGTFTKPSGVNKVIIQAIGGGGGGGGVYVSGGSGGGGAGGYCVKYADISATSSIQVKVGAAGAGGSGSSPVTDGGTGGTSSVGPDYCVATGGSGGTKGDSSHTNGGAGGTSSGGDLNITGGRGSYGFAGADGSGGSTTYNEGDGGSGVFGGNGSYGSGGRGSTSTTGENGQAGIVIITW